MAFTQAELQAEARTLAGTEGMFNEDLHAALTVAGVTADRQLNERLIEFTGQDTASAAWNYLLEYGFAVSYLLQNALVRFDETSIVGDSGVTLTNVGTGGSAYDCATNVGTAANRRRHPSGSALIFSGAGNRLSTPSAAANQITGDIDVRCLVAFADLALAHDLVMKIAGGGNISYFFYKTATNGVLRFGWSTDGSGNTNIPSTAVPACTVGEFLWLRATLDVDNGAGGHDVKFYTSTDTSQLDPSLVTGWTQLGSTVTTAGATSIYAGSASVTVGANGEVNSTSTCAVRRAAIYNGINGTLAVDMDPAQWATGTTFVSGGVTWTLNGNSFIQNTGVDCVTTIGSNALETAAGQTIASPATVFAVARFTNAAPGGDQYLFSTKSSGDQWVIFSDLSSTSRIALYQGSALLTSGVAYDNNLHVITGQFNGDASSAITVSGGAAVTGNAGTVSWTDFATLFADSAGGATAQLILADLIVIPGSVHSAYVTAINAYLKALYGTV